MDNTHRRLPLGRVTPGLTAVALLVAAILAPASFAAAPTPSLGSANVDGNTGEWDLAADFFTTMTNAGNPDEPVIANLYVRYDCDTEILYGLVLTVGDHRAQQDRPENAYLRIDAAGKLVSGESGDDGTAPDFAWVNGDGLLAQGWEASGPLVPGTYQLRAHVLIADDSADGYTPTDTVPRDGPLTIECPDPTPTPTPEVTPTPTPEVTPTPTPEVTPTPTPDVTPTPTPTGSEEPSEEPNPTPTPTPTGSEEPSEEPNPTPTPTGSVGGATGTPSVTLPPTDTLPTGSGGNPASDGLRLAFLVMAGIMGTLALVTPAWARRRIRRG